MNTDREHHSVLLEASLSALNLRADGIYVDATFGRGGHSRALLQRLGPAGRLLVMDRDPEAIAVARGWQRQEPRLDVVASNFDALAEAVGERGLAGRVDGVLFDFGVSSPQLDTAERGFSFRLDGPLDMRMDPLTGVSAAEWLAQADLDEIRRVLRRYGEEPQAGRIARAIVRERAERPLTRTAQLADLIERAVGGRRGRRVHPATRSFQAIRMQVNQELAAIEAVLPQAVAVLAPAGRLAVISFHSLEDRIVKRFMRDLARPAAPDPVSPPPPPTLRLCGRVRADEGEIGANPRARSAVLRIAEKVAP